MSFLRRRVERHRFFLEVLEIKERLDSKTMILDVSPLGAQLETDYSLSVNDLFQFTLSLPTGPAYFTGRVVWTQELPNESNRYRIGISFLNPYRGFNDLLAWYKESRSSNILSC